MATVKMLNMAGEAVGEIELKDDIFGIEINENAVYTVVKNYLANQRQGTQSAKTRSEVKGGGKKPYRQKGTGRARQGSRRAPNHVGGGIVFAPKPRSYRYPINKKVRRLATKSILTSKVQENELIVIDDIKFEAPKKVDTNVIKSASNIPGVDTTIVTALNVYDMLNHTSLILTQESANKIQEVYV